MGRRRKSRAVAINPLVVDLSHHNDVTDFSAVKAAGIAGIIHKATEGVGFTDKLYADRRGRALGVGLLWGAYHFLRPGSTAAQVDFFLKVAAPDNATLLALDHEDERVALIDAKEFLLRVEDAVGRKPVLYSGFLIKQQLGNSIDGYLAAHRLWLAQYGPRPVTPRNWPSAWLWQFTGDGVGPKPHSIPGIVGSGIDINSYERRREARRRMVRPDHRGAGNCVARIVTYGFYRTSPARCPRNVRVRPSSRPTVTVAPKCTLLLSAEGSMTVAVDRRAFQYRSSRWVAAIANRSFLAIAALFTSSKRLSVRSIAARPLAVTRLGCDDTDRSGSSMALGSTSLMTARLMRSSS